MRVLASLLSYIFNLLTITCKFSHWLVKFSLALAISCIEAVCASTVFTALLALFCSSSTISSITLVDEVDCSASFLISSTTTTTPPIATMTKHKIMHIIIRVPKFHVHFLLA